MSSQLRESLDGGTVVEVEASVDIMGRLAQFGRGLIQDISRQLIEQFAACVTERLETSESADTRVAVAPATQASVRILPLVLRATWGAIRRLFRRSAAQE